LPATAPAPSQTRSRSGTKRHAGHGAAAPAVPLLDASIPIPDDFKLKIKLTAVYIHVKEPVKASKEMRGAAELRVVKTIPLRFPDVSAELRQALAQSRKTGKLKARTLHTLTDSIDLVMKKSHHYAVEIRFIALAPIDGGLMRHTATTVFGRSRFDTKFRGTVTPREEEHIIMFPDRKVTHSTFGHTKCTAKIFSTDGERLLSLAWNHPTA
jgi:hypothetical protein